MNTPSNDRFTSGQIAEITKISQRRIIDWIAKDSLVPGIQDTNDGERWGYFSLENLFECMVREAMLSRKIPGKELQRIMDSCNLLLADLLDHPLKAASPDLIADSDLRILAQATPAHIENIQNPLEQQFKRHIHTHIMHLPKSKRTTVSAVDCVSWALKDASFLRVLLDLMEEEGLGIGFFAPTVGKFHVDGRSAYTLILGDNNNIYLRHTSPTGESLTMVDGIGNIDTVEGNYLDEYHECETLLEIHLHNLALRLNNSLAEFYKKPRRGTSAQPRAFSPHEMRKVGIEIIDSEKNRLRCQQCGITWEISMKQGGRLPKGYWHCETGCNNPNEIRTNQERN